MISYPSIDKLLNQVDSRYSLAILAAKRSHELENGDTKMLSNYKSPRSVGQALEEIADQKVDINPDSILSERTAEAEELMAENKQEKLQS
ncbi:DNA-directed RNA polymerase subunit omega [Lactobacillus sp. DCY120]|uniref:DNA-directed RNA polymerase subunit omega n=1 Tax=Bombilactobacillus apium TaxID=2675299 RepID=A0A850R4R2_9LACO|nr:DNA-directed RNA polymerase subunit omega [Bombilactobacillus apium]NVY96961.1 DNA-directed RNA polymerase subunit omega [Bombilactobacillus apium]